MFNIILSTLKTVFSVITGIIVFILYGKNSRLKKENDELIKQLENSDELIDTQKKVINVTKNTKPTDINGNIERMRQNKL